MLDLLLRLSKLGSGILNVAVGVSKMYLFLLHILSYDLWFYASHRLLHLPAFYWIHKKHHEKAEPMFLDTYHDSWLETPIQSLGILIPYAVMTFDPIQTASALAFLNIRGMLMHDPRGSFLTGDHHLIHHKLSNCNYGQYWIDYIMNTTYQVKRSSA